MELGRDAGQPAHPAHRRSDAGKRIRKGVAGQTKRAAALERMRRRLSDAHPVCGLRPGHEPRAVRVHAVLKEVRQ